MRLARVLRLVLRLDKGISEIKIRVIKGKVVMPSTLTRLKISLRGNLMGTSVRSLILSLKRSKLSLQSLERLEHLRVKFILLLLPFISSPFCVFKLGLSMHIHLS